MEQNKNDVKRQSIQAAKNQKKLEESQALAGIIDNESKTYTFEKEITQGLQKQKGTFTAKYMGVSARLRIGVIRARLLDGAPSQSLDPIADDIAYMIAYLTVALVKVPSWFNYDAMDDIGELRALYQEVYNFNKSFRGKNDTDSDAGFGSDTTGTEDVED